MDIMKCNIRGHKIQLQLTKCTLHNSH